MLILSRKRGESIMIGDDIEVQVLDIGDGKIRLGVTGPAWVTVHQRERYEARRRSEEGAAQAATQEILA
ncbi:MAG: carbon storage regulator [Phycisphaerales bacterium]|nr:MAG: carbon storage regulator [Phycisphaerales bacterium]